MFMCTPFRYLIFNRSLMRTISRHCNICGQETTKNQKVVGSAHPPYGRSELKSMKPRGRLLVVEDDPALQETLGEGLDDAGFDVVAVSNGTEAFVELDADAAQFEEVITDIDLGAGPDGWDVGRRARECVSSMPVVYMSGTSTEWPSQGVGDSVFVAKPFALAQMLHAHDVALTGGGTPTCAPNASNMATTYKVVKVPTTSGYTWGIVATSVQGEALRETLFEAEVEAQAEAERLTASATKVA
jgi:DNA-binding response OmpR family regulator